MTLYRLINSGKIQRREYYGKNCSSLFESLPQKDLTREQKDSYYHFLYHSLPQLLEFYFPVQFDDYNNRIRLEILASRWEEPKFSLEEVYQRKTTLSQKFFLTWSIKWHCEKVQFQTNQAKSKTENLRDWIEKSFKFSSKSFLFEQKAENKWQVSEKDLKIVLWLSAGDSPERLAIKFYYEKTKEIPFCVLPKMTERGNFIINGHNKVVIFQSVRAPNAYFFQDQLTQLSYGEIIPLKGSWIRVFLDRVNSSSQKDKLLGVKFKFLNTGATFDLDQILTQSPFAAESLLKLFDQEELIKNSLQLVSKKVEKNVPRFLFNQINSYFLLGKLGRQKFNRKMDVLSRLKEQTLAEDLKDKQGKVIFKSGTILKKKEIALIQSLLEEKKLPLWVLEDYQLCSFWVKSPSNPEKKLNILGTLGEKKEKIWFDWEDLLVFLSYFLNLQYGLGQSKEENEEKDSLENQIIRRVGDLLYNIFDNKLGIFQKAIENKYLAVISQLKKADPTKLPKIQEFNKALRSFFHSSTLVQLQNENNPLAEVSHIRKVSSLGLGGFNLTNVSQSIRNLNHSYYGRYCAVETPEGQKVGLIHNLTLNAEIDEHGQILAPYYLVKKGEITSQIIYLNVEEELERYIAHANISINQKNQIAEEKVWVRYQRKFVLVPKEEVELIDSSFYHLNSVNSSNVCFFQHNNSIRMLMTANMQKQIVVLLKGEAPLVASGIESYLLSNSSLAVKADSSGTVTYVDSEKILISPSTGKKNLSKAYQLNQFSVSNTNSLLTSVPLVQKNQVIKAGEIIACGNYQENQELALGQNLRVAFMCWRGYNFEDAIVLNQRLIKEEKLTSLFAKRYIVIRKKLKIDKKFKEEEFYPQPELAHLDEEGIVKVGSEIEENDILVSKRTPYKKQQSEELLIASIIGENSHSFKDSSFHLPWGEKASVVYQVNRLTKEQIYQRGSNSYQANDLEAVEICVAQKRRIETGDKLTTRFGNKGIIGKILPEIDMPFDQEGKTVDIIFNLLSVPSRMNVGQLLEVLLSSVSRQTKTKILVRPFNTPDWQQIQQIIQVNQIQDGGLTQLYDGTTGLPFAQKVLVGYIYTFKLNHMVADKFHARNTGPYALVHQQPVKGRAHEGGQRVGEMEAWALQGHGLAYNLVEMMGAKSDDLHLRRLIQPSLIFEKRELAIKNNQSESFNLLLQYLRSLGFDLSAENYQGKNIDFYKQFSKISRI